MSCQTVVVFCGISQSACTRKYRDTSVKNGSKREDEKERKRVEKREEEEEKDVRKFVQNRVQSIKHCMLEEDRNIAYSYEEVVCTQILS